MTDLSAKKFKSEHLKPHMRLTEAHDADEQAANLSDWSQRYDQMKPGRFYGRIDELLLSEIQFCQELTSHALRQSCVVWPSSFWFGLPPCAGDEASIDGLRLHPNSMAIKPGDEEFELVTPDDYAIMGIVVDATELERYAEAREIQGMSDLLGQREILLLEPKKKQNYLNLLEQMFLDLAANLALVKHGAALSALRHDLIDGLMDLLTHVQAAPPPSVAQQNHRRIFARVQDYLIAHENEAVSVMDLCEQLYVSRRTLQNCFHDLLGISPLTYLKSIRLNAARRELKNPDSIHHTVQDVAGASGFWHMGQFSADYHRLFCELPSETMHCRNQKMG